MYTRRRTSNRSRRVVSRLPSATKHNSALLRACPTTTLFAVGALFLVVYVLLANAENGLHLQYVKLQRSLATLRAEQDKYQLAIAQRRLLDPAVIERNWQESTGQAVVKDVPASGQ